jgi:phage shock protein PspC (stress-responsive transcriptional regulator)
MKKTLTINISGFVFNIDEDAYEKLKNYLTKIIDHFNREESGHEIINDIESRIAELFSGKISDEKNVIDEKMVDQIIGIMGLPEEFSETEENQSGENEKTTILENQGAYNQKSKKLYRDPDSRIIGGVCSGLSHYFNIDKLLVRIIFFILFIATSGVALPVYIILWIAVPTAKTTAQRLEMNGEPITVENIGKKVKEDVGEKKDSPNNYNNRSYKTERENRGDGLSVFGKIIGIILIFIGFSTFIGLIFGLFAVSKLTGMMPGIFPIPDHGIMMNHIFSQSMGSTLLFSILIIVGIPLLLIIYSGTKLLFNFVSNSRSVYLSALGIWIIGIIIAISSAVGAIDVFSSNATISEKKELTLNSDTIYIDLNKIRFSHFNTKIGMNNMKLLVDNGKEIVAANPKFDIEKSNGNQFELLLNKSSKGNNYRTAKKNAEEIEFSFKIVGDTILFDPFFILEKNEKWRSQDLKITLKVPEGKVIYMDENILPIIHNIHNTSNLWDGDMAGNYWIMKPEGLSLLKSK